MRQYIIMYVQGIMILIIGNYILLTGNCVSFFFLVIKGLITKEDVSKESYTVNVHINLKVFFFFFCF